MTHPHRLKDVTFPDLHVESFHRARAILGTQTEVEDRALYQAIQGYLDTVNVSARLASAGVSARRVGDTPRSVMMNLLDKAYDLRAAVYADNQKRVAVAASDVANCAKIIADLSAAVQE
jgi:hypothetical protein